MAETIRDTPGLKGSCPETPEQAWHRARTDAAEGLANYAHERLGETRAWKAIHCDRRRQMPTTTPNALESITAFEPMRDQLP